MATPTMAIFPVRGEMLPITIWSSVTPGTPELAILVVNDPKRTTKTDKSTVTKNPFFIVMLLSRHNLGFKRSFGSTYSPPSAASHVCLKSQKGPVYGS
jgi:hypothetical protein